MVYLLSVEIIQLKNFKSEILNFPLETREDIFSLLTRFLKGERLNKNVFKIFKIDKNIKILEFKVKDNRGNWRAIATIVNKRYLVFIYAFHKKSQELLEKDKEVIRKRIRSINL